MKENTLDVLFYLFENYPELEDEPSEDRESLNQYLQGAGFLPGEINRAFNWLESLGDEAHALGPASDPAAIRVFTAEEQRWLDTECRSYLLFLERAGVLNAETREQIIGRVLELEDNDFDLDRLKWVILMVLLNRPDEDNSFFWTEGLTLDGTQPIYH
ncbi:MAG: DUF494 domain-containing protein [Thiothrix sp.]|nr:DUF494 domain-containing protein [Thiothrix sp.]HPQ94485.1 DUF494 domain-containing protein [Thiolinea sp.]